MASTLMRGLYLPGVRCGALASSRLSVRAFACAPLTSSQKTAKPLLERKPLTVTPARLSSGDHVRLWTAERALTVGLLAVIPAAVLMPTPAIETALALSLTVHSHWGVEALVHDYIRPAIFGKWFPKLSIALVYGLSAMTFAGLCYFVWTDVGLVNAVAMLWRL